MVTQSIYKTLNGRIIAGNGQYASPGSDPVSVPRANVSIDPTRVVLVPKSGEAPKSKDDKASIFLGGGGIKPNAKTKPSSVRLSETKVARRMDDRINRAAGYGSGAVRNAVQIAGGGCDAVVDDTGGIARQVN